MAVIDLTDDTIEELVAVATVPVLVDVTAPWCAPCRMMEPVLDELAIGAPDELVVARLDADLHPETARRLSVMSFPTMSVFAEGEERGRLVGARGLGRLREDLRAVLG
jgi:thioredoxin 1